MKKKNRGYIPLLILTILFTLASVLTIIPNASISKECLLGYKALCSFTPVSTIILIIAAGITCSLRKRKFMENI
ncbi:hypothetical protein ISS37_03420 [candidate division KSB1 bacterium]|nr:hypothetical protein [candidate division KSB1 bacterium]